MPNEKETPQNSNSLSVSSGEANNKLLDILEKQILTVSSEIAKSRLVDVVVCLILLFFVSWTTWRLDKIENAVNGYSAINAQAKKDLRELKTAFGLKFSDERSRDKAKAKSE
jgi:ATP-dependent Zn protease